MKTLVCGGRDFNDLEFILTRMLRLHDRLGFTEVITGGARGADHWAHEIAVELGIPTRVFKADWAQHGKAAGIIRNGEMLDQGRPDMVMAFPGGVGTADMVRRSLAARVPVWQSKQIVFNSKTPKYEWMSMFARGFEFVDADGCVWSTAEHYYQSRKTADEHLRGLIQAIADPVSAKHRAKSFLLPEGWNPPDGEAGGLKEVACREALMYKYAEGSKAAKLLLGTNEDYLVHAAPWGDLYWGTNGDQGLNRLGVLLMERRDQLRA